MLEHNKQFCTFRLGDLFLGIDVIQVQEILRPQEMTHVPHAPSEVRGLINLRGQIVTAIDLRELLHVPPCEETSKEEQMNIVVRTCEGTVSFLVDAIGDVLDIPGSLRAPLPNTIPHDSTYFSSVFKLEDRLLIVLEPERVMGRAASATATRRRQ
jgi:purine-binding chemotaxis protein CheW